MGWLHFKAMKHEQSVPSPQRRADPQPAAIVYSVVIIAALCFGIILFLLQTIILPFLFALIAMYLLQVPHPRPAVG